ncbi:MAG: hypothetical protein K0S71_897 [Clostridia bacterium]|jgi:two-component system sensor histidine kinase YesM|nr:hypothetical protein [Clostridia bacterium]
MKFLGRLKVSKSIQYKLFLCFILIVIVPALTISICTYFVSLNILQDKVTESFAQTVEYVAHNVEENINQIKQVSDYIFSNKDIKDAINQQGKSKYQITKDTEVLYDIFDNFSIASVFRSINTVRIYDSDELLFSYSLDPTYTMMDDKKILESKCFKEAMNNNGNIVWTDLNTSYEINGNSDAQTLSIFRSIKSHEYNKTIGVMYLSIQPDYFGNISNKINYTEGGQIFLIDSQGETLNKQQYHIDSDARIHDILEDEDNIVIEENISNINWKIKGAISKSDIIKDSTLIFRVATIAIIISILLSCILWYIVSHSILRPIKALTVSCQKVRDGDLTAKVDIEGEDEVSILGSNFNYMIDKINELIRDVLEKQNRIKDAEYKTLQAQINPHFLYNTLNSVRWMAIIQKADNIKQAVECLARLLRNTTSKADIFIPIEEEVKNLTDYIYLQKLAYTNKFEVELDIDEKVLELKCLKFILQPLVENAIFHGIEPKEEVGSIDIKIYNQGDLIYFCIADDGVGIPEDKLGYILEADESAAINRENTIGVNNINQRIKNIYGSQYGLSIDSKEGRYTHITIVIPKIDKK